MATVWLTYAWEDNRQSDVDFVAQELVSVGINVKLDRWNIQAGKRLWEQIANFIQNPAECDAWIFYATQNSLGSEPCKEEFAYALDRALKQRNEIFPIIALFPSPVDDNLIPSGIKTRLYVSLTDHNWKERIQAAAENRTPDIEKGQILPFHITEYPPNSQRSSYILEVRPRAGIWTKFIIGIPIEEKDEIELNIMHGSSGQLPTWSTIELYDPILSSNKKWWVFTAGNQATPSNSYFLYFNKLPSAILFGPAGKTQWIISPNF